MKGVVSSFLGVLILHNVCAQSALPLVVTTWDATYATERAWTLLEAGRPILDVVERAISDSCELAECGDSVGPYGKVDEEGYNSQDAMIIDGATHRIGSVGGLRHVRAAISVARAVMNYSTHTLLVGDGATRFAREMGFPVEDTRTETMNQTWQSWRDNNCQPNSRQAVVPDPTTSCGPYSPANAPRMVGHPLIQPQPLKKRSLRNPIKDHDTICQIIVGDNGDLVAGTSTNGISFKIAGRVGDTPIPGAGAYVDNDVGAAMGTGNGDIMVRFLPSYHAVQAMRLGMTPTQAAEDAILRIKRYYPAFDGAIVAVNKLGEHGAACNAYAAFPYNIRNRDSAEIINLSVPCLTTAGVNKG